jgi:integrase/recombinase XerD
LQEKISLFIAGKKLEGLSESTLEGYESELGIFAKHVQKKANDITTNDIRTYLGKLGNLKNSSLSKKISIIKSFFGWLRNEEIIEKDNAFRIKTPKKEKRLPKGLTIEELELIRESCTTPRMRSMCEVYYATGCRLSEIHDVNRFNDIDWGDMSMIVIGKGDVQRKVYFGYKARYYLQKYLESRDDEEPDLFISERKPHKGLSCRSIEREFEKMLENSGLKKEFHPHVMRSTLASLLLEANTSLAVVQEILGHSDPKTTRNYARVSEGHINQEYKKRFNQ